MNALDLLFDFAALMSSSSAMMQSPETDDASNVQVDSIQTSEVPSDQGALVLPSESHTLQRTTAEHGQAHSSSRDQPVPQNADNVAVLSQTYARPAGRIPIDWVPAPTIPHQTSMQEQMTLGQDLLLCGHHPEEQCHCVYMPAQTMRSSYNCAPPFTWNEQIQQHRLEPQLFNQTPTNEYNGNGLLYGQQYECQYLPTSSSCINTGVHSEPQILMTGESELRFN